MKRGSSKFYQPEHPSRPPPNPSRHLGKKKNGKKVQMLQPVPKQPRRDVRTDVHVAFQLFNVNLDEEWDNLNIGISRTEFDNWFKQEKIALYDLERFNNKVENWLTEFLKDPFRGREQFKVSDSDMVVGKAAEKPENLLPLVVDITCEGRRYRDFFLWDPNNGVNLHEFIETLVADSKLPTLAVKSIVESCQQQIEKFQNCPLPTGDEIRDDLLRGYIVIEFRDSFRGIRVADKFLWNPYDEHVSPEKFAQQYVLDVGLSSEWAVLLGHTIRMKCWEHKTSIAQKQASGFQYSSTHLRNFVRTCEELDTEKWQPTVLVLKKA